MKNDSEDVEALQVSVVNRDLVDSELPHGVADSGNFLDRKGVVE